MSLWLLTKARARVRLIAVEDMWSGCARAMAGKTRGGDAVEVVATLHFASAVIALDQPASRPENCVFHASANPNYIILSRSLKTCSCGPSSTINRSLRVAHSWTRVQERQSSFETCSEAGATQATTAAT
jgi:hypothetical protein